MSQKKKVLRKHSESQYIPFFNVEKGNVVWNQNVAMMRYGSFIETSYLNCCL